MLGRWADIFCALYVAEASHLQCTLLGQGGPLSSGTPCSADVVRFPPLCLLAEVGHYLQVHLRAAVVHYLQVCMFGSRLVTIFR